MVDRRQAGTGVMRGGRSVVRSGATVVSMPLDGLSVPMAVCLSVAKRMLTSYEGAAFRVRRAADDEELDIGFDAEGLLDTAALTAHCTEDDGFVVTVYDQSGNARDYTQATGAAQPKIYDSSTGVLTQGAASQPAMLFDLEAPHFLARGDASGFSGNPDISVVFNWERTAASTAADGVIACIGINAGAVYGQILFPAHPLGNSILSGVRQFTPSPNVSTWAYYISTKAEDATVGESTMEQNGSALSQTGILNGTNTPNIVASSDSTWGAFPNASFPAGGSSNTLIYMPSVIAGADLTLMRAVMAAMA